MRAPLLSLKDIDIGTGQTDNAGGVCVCVGGGGGGERVANM